MRKFFIAFILMASTLTAAPAQAAGLLETLFGSSDSHLTYGARAYAPNEPHLRQLYDAGPRFRQRTRTATHARHSYGERARKNAKAQRYRDSAKARAQRSSAISGEKLQVALCCKNGENPDLLIHTDKTLRRGDAYMSPQGVRIYTGAEGESAFVALNNSSDVGRKMKARLAAMDHQMLMGVVKDTTSSDAPLAQKSAEPEMQQPIQNARVKFDQNLQRQLQRTKGVLAEKTIVDPRGKTVRVVGPYYPIYR